jgi:hypothetical protein
LNPKRGIPAKARGKDLGLLDVTRKQLCAAEYPKEQLTLVQFLKMAMASNYGQTNVTNGAVLVFSSLTLAVPGRALCALLGVRLGEGGPGDPAICQPCTVLLHKANSSLSLALTASQAELGEAWRGQAAVQRLTTSEACLESHVRLHSQPNFGGASLLLAELPLVISVFFRGGSLSTVLSADGLDGIWDERLGFLTGELGQRLGSISIEKRPWSFYRRLTRPATFVAAPGSPTAPNVLRIPAVVFYQSDMTALQIQG